MAKAHKELSSGDILTPLDGFNIELSTPSAFIGGTTDARGDKDGSNSAFQIYTVTGDVLVRIWGFCTTVMAGASATLSVGVTDNVAVLIALTTATDIDANEVWLGAAPSAVKVDALSDVASTQIIMGGANIIETVATADATSGNIRYVCLWKPLSSDGKVAGLSQ